MPPGVSASMHHELMCAVFVIAPRVLKVSMVLFMEDTSLILGAAPSLIMLCPQEMWWNQ